MEAATWHEWRSNGIGASDAPVIMGVSPWKNIHELWEEKTVGKKKEVDNWAMQRGRELEPLAIDFFMQETGIFLDEQKCVSHPKKEWMRATLDGINEEEKVLVEIKSCKKLHDEVPAHYYPQLQHQMEVVGYDEMFYLSFNGETGKLIKVKKDKEYIQTLIKKEEEFWKMVQTNTPPTNPSLNMEENEDWKDLAQRYKEVKKSLEEIKPVLDELKEEESFLKSQFILFADGEDAYGCGVKINKQKGRGSLDKRRLEAELNINLDDYKKEGSSYFRCSLY